MKIKLFDAMIDQKYGLTVYDIPSEDKDRITYDMHDWCTKTFGKTITNRYIPAKWKQSFTTFYFMTEKHRNLFLLRWA